jgi:hypothetical protein
MKENNELERRDLAIDSEMEVDCDIGQEITVYIETWFDVDKKFGTQVGDEDSTWLNLYGKYNPFADTLRLECEISRNDGSEYFDYMPTESEAKLIKDMIAEKISEQFGRHRRISVKHFMRQTIYTANILTKNQRWEELYDAISVSAKLESDGKSVALGIAGFYDSVYCRTIVSGGLGTASLFHSCSSDTLLWLSDNPHG